MRKDGIVKHGDLVHIWAEFRKGNGEFGSLAQTFMILLEKLGVCFVVSEDVKKPFMEQGHQGKNFRPRGAFCALRATFG